MRTSIKLVAAGAVLTSLVGFAQPVARLNPMITLLEAGKPIFGLYAPANPRAPRGGGAGGGGAAAGAAVPAPAPAMKTPAQLGADALAMSNADYIFDGTMEGNFDRGYPLFTEFARGIFGAGMAEKSPARLKQPLVVKMHELAPDFALAARHIADQLNLGVSGVVFVDVKTADEVKQGIAMMRFRSQGGTRPDDVGGAAAAWGLSDGQYREKADLWPLNPRGELINFTIVESREGLERIREIAAVKGIGVLFPGAGTLRGVFTPAGPPDSTGRPTRGTFDEKAWEGAIASVLAACQEFKVPCGYPANTAADMEARYKQGFRVFITGWGDAGFKAVDAGKRVSGR